MNIKTKQYIEEKMPYYGKLDTKGRYVGVKGKAWGILSDYVRCRDFLRYGTSVSSPRRILNWRESDAGHYYSMGGHGALLGFDDMNVHMQSSNENRQSSASDGAYYKEELIRRYGQDLLDKLARYRNESVKADEWYFLSRIEDIYEKFRALKVEFPDADVPKYVK